MGAIYFSIDVELLLALKSKLRLDVFVETGTFHGDTTISVVNLFDKIITVEYSDVLFKENANKFSKHSNIDPQFGNSPDVIQANSGFLEEKSVVYWLDAHWCGDTTKGKGGYECPLIDELNAIGSLNTESVILIDDARLFTEPPPSVHNECEWPTIGAVFESLKKLNDTHGMWIINDVIIFSPPITSEKIVEYSRSRGTNLHQLYQNNSKKKLEMADKIALLQEQNTELLEKVHRLKKRKQLFPFR